MGTLWTPSGEHPVDPERSDEPTSSPAGGTPSAPGSPTSDVALAQAAQALGLDLEAMTAEEREQLAAELTEMARVRAEVASTPVAEVLTSYLTRFFDLALIYLDTTPPKFNDAAVVIESFRAVIDTVGNELGENEAVLRQALAQAQMVFVKVRESIEQSDDVGGDAETEGTFSAP